MQHPTKLPYKVAIEIDIDCTELLDACGLYYTECEDDDTQNVVMLEYDEDEYKELLYDLTVGDCNEQTLGSHLLNPELGEYTTKVTIYKPTGDTIEFA